MRIQVKDQQGVQEWHIAIKGSFDFDVARACIAEMKAKTVAGKARLVFDLVDVIRLESCGLGAMLLVAERMPSRLRPEIRCCDPTVMAVLQVARMDRQFDLIPVGALKLSWTVTTASTTASTTAPTSNRYSRVSARIPA